MHKRRQLLFICLFILALVIAAVWYLHSRAIPVLEPRGPVGRQERELMIIGGLLTALVVVPVFIMTAVIAWRYQEGNHHAKYSPDWDHSRFFETTWWGIPIIIIGILSVVAWNSAHALDPYKALAAGRPPLTVQVVALDWKWLFIYPGQNVASVNYVQFPVNTPIDFEITSDTVMNSFWIPQLGGQIYAMPGMDTQLHLEATQAGSYSGSSANISGQGFAGMTFTAHATSQAAFNQWVAGVKRANNPLSLSAYDKLAKPSQNNPISYYSSAANGLFDDITMKYMMPTSNMPGSAM